MRRCTASARPVGVHTQPLALRLIVRLSNISNLGMCKARYVSVRRDSQPWPALYLLTTGFITRRWVSSSKLVGLTHPLVGKWHAPWGGHCQWLIDCIWAGFGNVLVWFWVWFCLSFLCLNFVYLLPSKGNLFLCLPFKVKKCWCSLGVLLACWVCCWLAGCVADSLGVLLARWGWSIYFPVREQTRR